MVFNADESMMSGLVSAKDFLLKDIKGAERDRSENKLMDIVEKYGPVVDGYPSWHPLVTHHGHANPLTDPHVDCGYKGLDHTIYFVNAFITCPYRDGEEIIDSVSLLPSSHAFTIEAERLDVQLYHDDATPILVYCEWDRPMSSNGMIPSSLAIPLMLQKEVPCWEWAELGESWEAMRYLFLGEPYGSTSSLFVNEETCLTMKKIWDLLNNSGMFGPMRDN